MCRCAFLYFQSDSINRKWSNLPKHLKISCFYEQPCTGHISGTKRPTHLILVASEMYGSLDVPLALLVRFYQPEVTEVAIKFKGCAFQKQACTGHISGTERPIHLILVANERY